MTDLDRQQQVGAARRYDAAVRRMRGRQHARQARQHVRPDGRLGVTKWPIPPAHGPPERGFIARKLVTLVARALAIAVDPELGLVAALDSGRKTQH